MSETRVTKEAVSVSEMAGMVGMSRARFYQLMGEGVFPSPSRQNETGRPFSSRDQQEQCLGVRRTNCGINGKALLFYATRAPETPPTRTAPAILGCRRQSPARSRRDETISILRRGLTQLGMPHVVDREVHAALVAEYPDGHDDVDPGERLRAVFGRLNRQSTYDNVAR